MSDFCFLVKIYILAPFFCFILLRFYSILLFSDSFSSNLESLTKSAVFEFSHSLDGNIEVSFSLDQCYDVANIEVRKYLFKITSTKYSVS